MTLQCPRLIADLDTLFERTLSAIDAAKSSKNQLDRELCELTGYVHDAIKWSGSNHGDIENEVRTFAYFVVRFASEQLSARGARLDIHTDEYLASFRDAERAIRNRHCNDINTTVDQMMVEVEAVWRAFRPAAMWAQIEAHCSPAAVASHACTRAALCLVESFQLAWRPTPRLVKGRVELEMSVSSQRTPDGLRFRRCQIQRLYFLAEAFETFAVASFPEDATGLDRVGYALSRCTEVALRKRLDLGAGVDAVVYLTAIKLYLPTPIAEALNQFVTLHAPSAFASRSAA